MTNCRICNQTMHNDGEQPRPRGGLLHYITCHNPECPMNGHTLTREGYATLDLSPYLKPKCVITTPPR
jgi:hypothetical protein